MQDHSLIGFALTVDKEDDPCEVYLSDYKDEGGKQRPPVGVGRAVTVVTVTLAMIDLTHGPSRGPRA